jgi:hypothetical protein
MQSLLKLKSACDAAQMLDGFPNVTMHPAKLMAFIDWHKKDRPQTLKTRRSWFRR